MDLNAIIDEFNRRKAQAGQSVNDLLGSQPVRNITDFFGGAQMQGQQTAQAQPQMNAPQQQPTPPKTYEGRPVIQNPDGSWSHERSVTVEVDGLHMNIPTLFGGKQYDPRQAIEILRKNNWIDPDNGKYIQAFKTQEEALAAAQAKEAAQQKMTQPTATEPFTMHQTLPAGFPPRRKP